jgi:3-hydroxyacyl-[acyl-carrier-protein] dehydratase
MADFGESPGGRLHARFRFDPDFIGFAGHFPDRQVLPGVCQLAAVKAVLGEWKGRSVRLLEIVSAKYVLPVTPGDECVVECWDLKETGDECSLKAGMVRGDEKVSEFRMRVSFDGAMPREDG